jgi:S-(hydroxymethyl)glutathione dehydrogenase/alcohol dehydrogenase
MYFASHPEQGKFIKIDPFELISGKKIYGSWGGGCKPDIDIPRLTKSFKSGTFPLNKLITKRYSLEQVNEALLDLENGLVFRPLIKMSH